MKNILNVNKILLDFDGVIVDALDMFSKLRPEIADFESHLKILTISGKKEEFVYPLILEAIDKEAFKNAQPTHFLFVLNKLLIPYWKTLGIEIEILTSTMTVNPKRDQLVEQKEFWHQKYLPELKINFCDGSSKKQEWAKEGVLLIDDFGRTISQFIKQGGFGIHYTSLNETLNQLRIIGLSPHV